MPKLYKGESNSGLECQICKVNQNYVGRQNQQPGKFLAKKSSYLGGNFVSWDRNLNFTYMNTSKHGRTFELLPRK